MRRLLTVVVVVLLGASISTGCGRIGKRVDEQIEVVGNQFAKFEKMGFTDRLQKYIVSACWAAYWVFMFFGMTSYAAAVPDDLGWGATVLESSFGLLRFAFFIVSIFRTLLQLPRLHSQRC